MSSSKRPPHNLSVTLVSLVYISKRSHGYQDLPARILAHGFQDHPGPGRGYQHDKIHIFLKCITSPSMARRVTILLALTGSILSFSERLRRSSLGCSKIKSRIGD